MVMLVNAQPISTIGCCEDEEVTWQGTSQNFSLEGPWKEMIFKSKK